MRAAACESLTRIMRARMASSGSSPVAAAPSFPRRRAGRAWSPFRSSVLSFCKSEQFCTDCCWQWAQVHQDFTFSQWERLRDDDRAAHIAVFIDTLATMAATQPAQRAARHYSECIMRSQLTARDLANFLREYARAHPELQRGSVQRAMNDYLNALCGRPLD